MRAKLAAALVLAAAALASAVLFFYFRDNFATHYPVKVISAAAWRAGAIPWWNFYAGGGQPLAGNPNTLAFYPDNVLYLLLPAHIAFNLHFVIHLIAAWWAMRALSRSRWAAWLYVLSGIAISAMCFYNLITALALVPFALWAAERGRWVPLGAAFGLMALAGEPVTIAAAAIACLWSAAAKPPLWKAIPLAIVIALPQLIAYNEIAREVERGAVRYSARTVLAASFHPLRFIELVIGPFLHINTPHLFPTVILGLIVIPALARRSRYVAIAAVMFFIALGAWNPLIRVLVERVAWLRLGRYPEKFALVGCVALVVVVAEYFRETRFKLLWTIVTFVPLLAWAAVLLPVDRFAPYDLASQPPARVYVAPRPGGQTPNRAEYRRRAVEIEPIFGAVAGVRYALDRSPDGMYSAWTRVAAERFTLTRNANYATVVLLLPRAMIVPRTIIGGVQQFEAPSFDPRVSAIAPQLFVSPPDARVTSVREHAQMLEVDVSTSAPALLFVNETYFGAWVARAGGRELRTLPLDLDRLGVLIPAGPSTVTLTFGRHHGAVIAAWAFSLLAMALGFVVEILDRRAGEVERAADEERAAA